MLGDELTTFGQRLYAYIATIVPHWRVSDDAWLLRDGSYLLGIGVLRNYGGSVLAIPWPGAPELANAIHLPRAGEENADFSNRIVIADDRHGPMLEIISRHLSPVAVIPWSERHKLAELLIKDSP